MNMQNDTNELRKLKKKKKNIIMPMVQIRPIAIFSLINNDYITAVIIGNNNHNNKYVNLICLYVERVVASSFWPHTREKEKKTKQNAFFCVHTHVLSVRLCMCFN